MLIQYPFKGKMHWEMETLGHNHVCICQLGELAFQNICINQIKDFLEI